MFMFRRRVYLPTDLMAAHGVSAESVVRGRDTENLRACAESVAARAQEHLESSREEVYRIIRLNRLINLMN